VGGHGDLRRSRRRRLALATHSHDFVTNGGTVGGKPHNNMQPSLALLYCRKI
jgi:microcystin-dependent protein